MTYRKYFIFHFIVFTCPGGVSEAVVLVYMKYLFWVPFTPIAKENDILSVISQKKKNIKRLVTLLRREKDVEFKLHWSELVLIAVFSFLVGWGFRGNAYSVLNLAESSQSPKVFPTCYSMKASNQAATSVPEEKILNIRPTFLGWHFIQWIMERNIRPQFTSYSDLYRHVVALHFAIYFVVSVTVYCAL